jgi:simple sugar transport system permease protein
MNDRLTVAALSVLAALSAVFAPWASFNRETAARGAVTLLPNRTIDFTGRTPAVDVPQLTAVAVILALLLAVLLVAAWLPKPARHVAWLAGGVALMATSFYGLSVHASAYDAARTSEVRTILEEALREPSARTDVEGLESLIERFDTQTLEATRLDALQVGVRIRRLPYADGAPGLAAFMALLTGGLAVLFGLRAFRRGERAVQALADRVAVPLTAIVLALAAAAVVILILQPTPLGQDVQLANWREALAGRLDTLFYAYWTLFSGSLGTFEGFTEALKFATPLIFTGLGVGFGFQAGLFNIGAPGQMAMGAIFAMLAGIYLPGPGWLVLPLAVAAAAAGGALWGAIPGFLKARFGANEVINTILMNFIASSLLLFILSSSPVFAASALRILTWLGVALLVVLALVFIPQVRALLTVRPRASAAGVMVALLAVMTVAGWPRAGDGPVTVNLPFKAAGSEPKSVPLQDTARLPQLPELFGVDPTTMVGSTDTTFNLAAWLAVLTAVLAWTVAGRLLRARPWWARLLAAAGAGVAVFAVLALAGLRSMPVTVPPSNLNAGFLIALAAAVFMHVFLWRTKWGYELRAAGQSPGAAEYGGVNLKRNTVMAMAMSGGFAGLTATHYVLGGALEDFSLRVSLPTSDGFDGIAVALLGANNPLGIVLSAFLFGVLKNGGSALNITFTGLTRDVVNMVLALVVLFIAARGFLPERLTDPIKRAAWRRNRTAAAQDDAPGEAQGNANAEEERA